MEESEAGGKIKGNGRGNRINERRREKYGTGGKEEEKKEQEYARNERKEEERKVDNKRRKEDSVDKMKDIGKEGVGNQ